MGSKFAIVRTNSDTTNRAADAIKLWGPIWEKAECMYMYYNRQKELVY